MSPEMKKMLADINAKKAEIKNMIAEDKLDEAEAAKKDLDALQRKFNLMLDLADDEGEAAQAHAKNMHEVHTQASGQPTTFARLRDAFVNAIGAGVGKRKLNDDDKQVLLDAMTEGSDPDGGLTVPKDIQTKIKELRRSDDNLEQYVNVEPVATMTGSRVIEIEADTTEWPDVEEGAEYTEAATPKFKKIDYKVTKKGGLLKASLELLADTAENILGYLNKWIAKKTRATRNNRILTAVRTITTGKEVAITGLDGLKDIFNVVLDPAIASSAAIFTNQTGYNWLDKLKDDEGRYMLQPDPTDKTRDLLFGKYPVHKLSDKVLKSTEVKNDQQKVTGYKVPFICGDMREAITLFDREFLTVESSMVAGDLWGKDQLGIKVRDRFDVKTVDEKALVEAQVTLAVAG